MDKRSASTLRLALINGIFVISSSLIRFPFKAGHIKGLTSDCPGLSGQPRMACMHIAFGDDA
jgi:hypothetical protein